MSDSMHQPTPQPSGRTAEEILDTVFCEGMESTQNEHNSDWMEHAQRQLFDALLEIVNEVELETNYNTKSLEVTYLLTEKLRIFFNQPKASGK